MVFAFAFIMIISEKFLFDVAIKSHPENTTQGDSRKEP